MHERTGNPGLGCRLGAENNGVSPGSAVLWALPFLYFLEIKADKKHISPWVRPSSCGPLTPEHPISRLQPSDMLSPDSPLMDSLNDTSVYVYTVPFLPDLPPGGGFEGKVEDSGFSTRIRQKDPGQVGSPLFPS